MTTRYTAKPGSRFGVPGLPTGYESKAAPEGITIPSVGIQDVEKALFDLFNEGIPLVVDNGDQGLKRVPVIFSAGEKWALLKKKRALRDGTGSLILPLITIVRTSFEQSPTDITGRGINQQTGEIIIHRRLDKSDRTYQGLINRLLLNHQLNLAVKPEDADVGQLSTLRDIGDMSEDPQIQQGMLLLPDRRNNVFETIVVPSPQFFTAKYDVTVWTQYTSHMSHLIEQVVQSQLQQGNCWKLDTPKGYWFVATVDGNSYTSDNNTDDFSQSERLVRTKFVINVPGYVLASKVPGAPVPIKRYVSSPTVSFSLTTTSPTIPGLDASAMAIEPFLGADDPTLPLNSGDDAPPRRRDIRNVNGTRLFPNVDSVNPEDPALGQRPRGTPATKFQKVTIIDSQGNTAIKLLRIRGTNSASGETILASDVNLDDLTNVITED